MAINGDGFFSVQKPGGFSDNAPVFDGVDRYTRRGDFQVDKQGFLVNGAGYYLMGIPVDPTTGNLVGSTPEVLQFQSDFLPAQQTTKVDYRANLASYPLTTAHDNAVPGSELLRPSSFSAVNNPVALGTPAPPYTDATMPGLVAEQQADGTDAITAATLLSGAAEHQLDRDRFRRRRLAHGERHRHQLPHSGGGTPARRPPARSTSTRHRDGRRHHERDRRHHRRRADHLAGGRDHAAHRHRCEPGAQLDQRRRTRRTRLRLADRPGARWRRHAGTGQVIGNDLQAFLDESIAGGAVTAFDIAGSPVNLQFRWAKVDYSVARRRPHRHLEPVLSGRSGPRPARRSPGRT